MSGREYRRDFGAPAAELRPDFFMDTVKDELASHQAGRDIFREIERVRIVIPGAVASMVVKNVDDSHRNRWPEHYAAFRGGREQPLVGLPLTEWPVLNRAQVRELEYLQIRTVEELAGLSDVHLQSIGMGGRMLRERARAYLDEAEHEALTTKLVGENDVLRSRVAALETQVAELGKQLVTLAHQRHQMADMPHAVATLVPGADDPFQRQAYQGALVEPPAPPSALDGFAEMPERAPRHRRRRDPDFDPAAADDADAA